MRARLLARAGVFRHGQVALGVMAWSMVRKTSAVARWVDAHSTTMFYCALVLYSAFGLALGLLLGRMTRVKLSGREGVTMNNSNNRPAPRPPPECRPGTAYFPGRVNCPRKGSPRARHVERQPRCQAVASAASASVFFPCIASEAARR